jgi:hypothetical protein
MISKHCPDTHVELYVITKAQTDKALLCDFGDKEVWVPQSQIHDNSDVWQVGDKGDLMVSVWWATKAGVI